MKGYLDRFLNQNKDVPEDEGKPTLFKLIDRFISGEIKNKGKEKAKNTFKEFKTTKDFLFGYQHYITSNLIFEAINMDFFYKYVTYLRKQIKNRGEVVSKNTVSKYLQTLKTFIGEAVDLGYTTNLQFKHRKFVVDRVDTDAVYLTEKELNALYKFDFSDNKRLEQVRDLFVFGAWVGLRYSDYSNVKLENIVEIENEGEKEYMIKLITKKTKELVIIPCNPVVLDLFNKYEKNPNKLPNSISNQKFNEYLKEVCKEAGLTEQGRLSTNPELKLYECVSSHTARR